jgi:hypothetical protein
MSKFSLFPFFSKYLQRLLCNFFYLGYPDHVTHNLNYGAFKQVADRKLTNREGGFGIFTLSTLCNILFSQFSSKPSSNVNRESGLANLR